MPKQVLHIDSAKGMNAAESNEHGRRWDRDEYKRQNQKPGCWYDWTRRHLNFEITPDRKLRPLDGTGKSVEQRFNERMEHLDMPPLDMSKDAKKLPNRLAKFIISGETNHIRKMAFGDQKVDFNWNIEVDNSRVRCTREFERWAFDVYDFFAAKYGAANIVGFNVHLDETSPHIHCAVVPVTTRIDRKTGHDYETVSYKAHFGATIPEGKVIRSQLHDDMYHQVGYKYGLERGDRGAGKKHMNKVDYFRWLQQVIPETEAQLDEIKSQIDTEQTRLNSIQDKIDNGEGDVQRLKEKKKMVEGQLEKLQEFQAKQKSKLAEWDKKLASMRTAIAREETALKRLDQTIESSKSHLRQHAGSVVSGAMLTVLHEQFLAVLRDNPEIRSTLGDTLLANAKSTAEFVNDGLEKLWGTVLAGLSGAEDAPVAYSCGGGGGTNNDSGWGEKKDDFADYVRRCALHLFRPSRPAPQRSIGRRR
ncbi:MAG: plasmid recombination protein [Bacteroidales bacterium]|nr:plasmid recombination protein [Bacteroidales bacterium]